MGEWVIWLVGDRVVCGCWSFDVVGISIERFPTRREIFLS